MKDGVASHTARSVAAHRLTYERVPADYGEPEADIALMRDVAAGLEVSHGRMHEYIRARTAFFDRVVVGAVDSGVRQVVVGGGSPASRHAASGHSPPITSSSWDGFPDGR
jgi:O-methyltransferase involved in polyketide biosynthesis